jgi:hypothetical protein
VASRKIRPAQLRLSSATSHLKLSYITKQLAQSRLIRHGVALFATEHCEIEFALLLEEKHSSLLKKQGKTKACPLFE